jgi:PAS domain S-box-containing protein
MKTKHYLEEELFLLIKKDNEVFDFIQDFALDGLWYWDLDNPDNEWMNKKFWITLGYEPGELPYSPSSWNKLVYEKDLNKINKLVTKYLKNPVGLFNSTVRYRHKNGSILWIKCYGKLFKDKKGNFNRFLGAHQNITELKQYEINLEKSNSIANIGFWEFDIENKEFHFNKQALRIIGISSGKKISAQDLLSRIYRKEITVEILKNIKNRAKKTDIEFEFKDYNYEFKWIRLIFTIEKFNEKVKIFGTIQDINLFKKLEFDLYLKNQKLNSILNEMNEVVWSMNLKNSKLQFITPNVSELYGKPINYFEENFKNWENFVIKEDRHIIEKINNDIKYIGFFNEKYRIIDAFGNLKYIKHQGRVIYNMNKKPDRIDGIIINRTKQGLAEEKLAYEENFRNLLLNIASKFIEIKLEKIPHLIQDSLKKMGKFVGADRGYVFEYNFHENTCSNTFEWCNNQISPEINNLQNVPISSFNSIYEKQLKGENISIYDVSKLHDNNSIKQILVSQGIQSILLIPLMHNNNLFGFVGFDYVKKLHLTSKEELQLLGLFANMLSSIHQRKIWENKLVQQEEKYRNIITNIQLGLIELDENLNIVFGNDIFKNIYGIDIYSKIESLSFKEFIGIKNLKTEINSKIKTNGELIEFKIKTLKKEVKWILMSLTENLNDKGKRKGYIALFIDITKEKQTQKDLIDAKKKAEQAAFAKDNFLTNMSHEIRTPIHIMIGIFRLLKENPQSLEFLDWIKKGEGNAKYLLSIINTILDKNKIEKSGVVLNFQSFFIKDICNLIHDQFIELATEQNNTFKIEYNCSSSDLYSDPTKIQQVLVNLLSNSFKFTKNGKVNLIVKELENNDDYIKVYFEVNDTGVGINKKFTKEIFNKFTQESNVLNTNHKGSGLGLSIAQDVIMSLGSEIKLQSEINKGSKFYFTLKISKNKQNQTVTHNHNNNNNDLIKKQIKILLVEDNEMNRYIAKQTLKKINSQVWEATNGYEALKVISNEQFDLILMDIKMPLMDGITCTKHIRENLKLNTPIVAFTANAFNEDIEKYKKIGINETIIKPYEENNLLNLILQLVNSNTLFDLSFVYNLTQNNKELIAEMMKLFFKVTNEALINLNKSIENKNIEYLKKVVHKCKVPLHQLKIEKSFKSIEFIEKYNGTSFTNELITETKNITTIIEKVLIELENLGYKF